MRRHARAAGLLSLALVALLVGCGGGGGGYCPPPAADSTEVVLDPSTDPPAVTPTDAPTDAPTDTPTDGPTDAPPGDYARRRAPGCVVRSQQTRTPSTCRSGAAPALVMQPVTRGGRP